MKYLTLWSDRYIGRVQVHTEGKVYPRERDEKGMNFDATAFMNSSF